MQDATIKRPLVIYHANCTDGFSAAWCFHHVHGPNECDFHPASYGSEPPDVNNRRVYLVDFSYSREQMTAMVESAERVWLIDHHETAFKAVGDGIYGLHTFMDQERSGAMLAWDFLRRDKEPPMLLQYVQDRDLWNFKLPSSHEVNAYIACLDQTFEVWDQNFGTSPNMLAIVGIGVSLLRQRKKYVTEIARQHRVGDIFGFEDIPVCNCPGMYASDVGHELCADKPFSVTYYDGHNAAYFSMRSRPDGANVEQLAKTMGGGGHVHASGFKIRYDDHEAWTRFYDKFDFVGNDKPASTVV